MKLNDADERCAMKTMKAASRIAEENGITEMTLEEINEEIDEVRNKK